MIENKKSKSEQSLEALQSYYSCTNCHSTSPGERRRGLCKVCIQSKSGLHIFFFIVAIISSTIIIINFHIGGLFVCGIILLASALPSLFYKKDSSKNGFLPDIESIQKFTVIDTENSEQEFLLNTENADIHNLSSIYDNYNEIKISHKNENGKVLVYLNGIYAGSVFDEENMIFLSCDSRAVFVRLYKICNDKYVVIVKFHFTERNKDIIINTVDFNRLVVEESKQNEKRYKVMEETNTKNDVNSNPIENTSNTSQNEIIEQSQTKKSISNNGANSESLNLGELLGILSNEPFKEEEYEFAKNVFRFIADYDKAELITLNEFCRIECIILAFFLLASPIGVDSPAQLFALRVRLRSYLCMNIVESYNISQRDLENAIDNRLDVYSKSGDLKNPNIYEPFTKFIVSDIDSNDIILFGADSPKVVVDENKQTSITKETRILLSEINTKYVPIFLGFIHKLEESTQSNKKQKKESKKRFCKQCGGELDNNKKCTKCRKQYFNKNSLKNRMPLIIVCVCLVCSIGVNIYQLVYQNKQLVQVQEQYKALVEKDKSLSNTIEQKDNEIKQLREANDNLLDLEQEQEDKVANLRQSEEMEFVKSIAVFIYDFDNVHYHKDGCMTANSEKYMHSEYTYSAYIKKELAENAGYSPCPDCCY